MWLRPRTAGSTSCSCSCRRRRDQPAAGFERARHRDADASATTRSSSPTATRRRSRAATADGCGTSGTLPDVAPPDCAINARTEILDRRSPGISPIVNVNRANSIENRLNKLLQHLAATRPAAEGWAQFVDGDGTRVVPDRRHRRRRSAPGRPRSSRRSTRSPRVMLHGWTDASTAGSSSARPTPAGTSRSSTRETASSPARATPTRRSGWHHGLPAGARTADRQPPAAVRQTRCTSSTSSPAPRWASATSTRPGTSRDGWIARDADGSPSRVLVSAWRSVLGDSDADSYLDQARQLPAGRQRRPDRQRRQQDR